MNSLDIKMNLTVMELWAETDTRKEIKTSNVSKWPYVLGNLKETNKKRRSSQNQQHPGVWINI